MSEQTWNTDIVHDGFIKVQQVPTLPASTSSADARKIIYTADTKQMYWSDGTSWVLFQVGQHNNLTGIQGGSIGNYYHLTNTERIRGLAKGWVVYDASTTTVLDSYNVDSVVRNSVCNYTINWSSNFNDSDYVMSFSADGTVTGATTMGMAFAIDSIAAGSVTFRCLYLHYDGGVGPGISGISNQDPQFLTAVAFGVQ